MWSAELDIYGRVMTDRNHAPKGDIDFVPFRYQGQYHDTETGLYYNRFRYYDPTTGNYTQQDPIGLEGNNPTLYAYVKNLNCQIDPFGLEKCRLSKDDMEEMGPKPKDIKNPHRHHIVREKAPSGWDKIHKDYITDAQDIVKNFGIDVNRSLNNFVWASLGEGNHSKAAAKYVWEDVRERF